MYDNLNEDDIITEADSDNFNDYGVRLKVIGVGGAGNNSLNHLYNDKFKENIEYWAFNTDKQALFKNKCTNKLALGNDQRGFGTGGDPKKGEQAANESTDKIREILANTDMLILTAGFGGGTGTGATPVICKIAKELGILTLAIVNTPYNYEGKEKERIAYAGIEELKKYVDSYVLVSNQKMCEIYADINFIDANKASNVILKNAIDIIYEILYKPIDINIDFNDLKNVLTNGKEAIITYHKSSGKDKILKATTGALTNQLFDNDIKSCSKMLVCFSFDSKVTMAAINEATNEINKAFGAKSDLIQKKIGVSVNASDDRADFFATSIIATGINDESQIHSGLIGSYFNEDSKSDSNIASGGTDEFNSSNTILGNNMNTEKYIGDQTPDFWT